MSLFGKRDQYSDAPKFAADDKGNTGQDEFGTTVFGVDTTESAVARADGKGSVPPGWVKVTTGTGGRSGRVTYETLAEVSSMTGDATDFANTATVDVANTTGTADDATFPDV